MSYNDFKEFYIDIIERCEANHELDEIKKPDSHLELFDAWERAHQDRKDLLSEFKTLKGSNDSVVSPDHTSVTWPGHPWSTEYCWYTQRDCFCAWNYYYGKD